MRANRITDESVAKPVAVSTEATTEFLKKTVDATYQPPAAQSQAYSHQHHCGTMTTAARQFGLTEPAKRFFNPRPQAPTSGAA